MKNLWSYIEEKNWNEDKKYAVTLLIVSALAALAGLALWLLIGIRVFSAANLAVCFVGYPVLIATYVAILYLFRHEFQTGVPQE